MTSRTGETIAQHPADRLLDIVEAAALSDDFAYFDRDANMRIIDDGRVGRWRAWIGVSSEGRAPAHHGSDPDAIHLAHITLEEPGYVSRADYYEIQDGSRVFWQPHLRPDGEVEEDARYLSLEEISNLCVELAQ